MLVLEDLVGLHKVDQLLSGSSDWGIDLDFCDIEWFALEMTKTILSFLRLYPSTAFQTLLLTIRVTPFLQRDSFPQ